MLCKNAAITCAHEQSEYRSLSSRFELDLNLQSIKVNRSEQRSEISNIRLNNHVEWLIIESHFSGGDGHIRISRVTEDSDI